MQLSQIVELYRVIANILLGGGPRQPAELLFDNLLGIGEEAVGMGVVGQLIIEPILTSQWPGRLNPVQITIPTSIADNNRSQKKWPSIEGLSVSCVILTPA